MNQKRHLDYEETGPEEEDSNEDKEDEEEGMRLDWRVSEWTRCSQTCGTEGKQVNYILPWVNFEQDHFCEKSKAVPNVYWKRFLKVSQQ